MSKDIPLSFDCMSPLGAESSLVSPSGARPSNEEEKKCDLLRGVAHLRNFYLT